MKSLASKPQVLENCPVLGSRRALFFKWLKLCRLAEKCFSRPFFFLEIDGKKFLRPFFLGKHLHLCPWSLASSIPVFGLGLGVFLCPWPWPRALCPRLHLCFFAINFGIYCLEIVTKLLTSGLKYLINRSFCFGI